MNLVKDLAIEGVFAHLHFEHEEESPARTEYYWLIIRHGDYAQTIGLVRRMPPTTCQAQARWDTYGHDNDPFRIREHQFPTKEAALEWVGRHVAAGLEYADQADRYGFVQEHPSVLNIVEELRKAEAALREKEAKQAKHE